MTDTQIAEAIKTAIATRASSGAQGIVSVTIDGVATTYSWDQAVKELEFWERRAARSSGRKKLVQTLDLRNI